MSTVASDRELLQRKPQGHTSCSPASRLRDRLWAIEEATWLRLIICTALVLGAGLRLTQFLTDRSLFLDEVFVAQNITSKGFTELVQTLEHDQRAPAGFLAAVKLSTLLAGSSDLVLRLVPLISGLLGLVAFPLVMRRWFDARSVAIGTVLFSFSPTLIFFSSDLKQYSTDALMTLLVLGSVPVALQHVRWSSWIRLGLVGAAALWFSFPTLFVIAAVGISFLGLGVARKDRQIILGIVVSGLFWGLAAIALYWIQVRHFPADPEWKLLWNDSFWPVIPHSFSDLLWLPKKLIEIIVVPGGIGFAGVGLSLVILSIHRHWGQQRIVPCLLLAPVACALAASAIRVYPFGGRVITFLAPIACMMIADGLSSLSHVTNRRVRVLTCMLALFVLYDPANAAAKHVLKGEMYRNRAFGDYKFEESRAAMQYIRDHWNEGDRVYLYSDARIAFSYYSERFGFQSDDTIQGIQSALMKPHWDEIREDLEQLRGRGRVWIFFTHVWHHNSVDDRKLYLYFLDHIGTQIDAYESPDGEDAWAYLYDFSQPPGKQIP